jgi:hypothetical protein
MDMTILLGTAIGDTIAPFSDYGRQEAGLNAVIKIL